MHDATVQDEAREEQLTCCMCGGEVRLDEWPILCADCERELGGEG